MTGAKSDLRDVHLNHFTAIVRAAPFMESAAGRAFDLVQRVFNFLDRLIVKVIKFQEDRTLAALKFVVELPHHLA